MATPKKTAKTAKPGQYRASAAELANDPSLRYCGYTPGEALETPAGTLRYGGRTLSGDVVLLTLNGMAPAATYHPLAVHRLTGRR